MLLCLFVFWSPSPEFFARVFPFLDNEDLIRVALPDDLLSRTLDAERVSALRHDIANNTGFFVRPIEWTSFDEVQLPEKVDIILSKSVLQHVDDLKGAYRLFSRTLTPDGAMSHLIDFRATTYLTNGMGTGAVTMPCGEWSVAGGIFLINRMPHSVHVDLLRQNGFRIVDADLLRRVDGLTRDQFVGRFSGMSPKDATICLASVTCVTNGF